MGWLFARHLRPFVLLAGAASLALNVALLAPALTLDNVSVASLHSDDFLLGS